MKKSCFHSHWGMILSDAKVNMVGCLFKGKCPIQIWFGGVIPTPENLNILTHSG